MNQPHVSPKHSVKGDHWLSPFFTDEETEAEKLVKHHKLSQRQDSHHTQEPTSPGAAAQPSLREGTWGYNQKSDQEEEQREARTQE